MLADQRPPVPPAHQVRDQLGRILASRAFLKAESLSKLLRFIVEQELAGNRDRLREQVIAEDVFSRRDFDSQTDTIVRTQARRLRARLSEYYQAEGRTEPVVIEFEKGSYVPVFKSVAPQAADAPESSLVVLPFLNLTGNADEEYFSDGLTEEVITAFSRIKGLKVVARTSSFAFKGREKDIREIGRLLRVSTVLEGSVRRSGDRLRVTAQLIDAKNGFHLWSENYDRQVSDVVAVQDEIANAIAGTLLHIGPRPAVRRAPVNMEAYYSYLKALQAFYRVSTDSVRTAIELLERAIALDPAFAPAQAYLAMTLSALAWWGLAPAGMVLPRARELAERARAIDPDSPEARLALAWIRFSFRHVVSDALDDFDDLFEAAPGFAFGRLAHAYALLAQRRSDEARAAVARAMELDPLSPVYVYNQAVISYFDRAWDDVERYGQAVLSLAPEFAEGYLALAVAALETGRFDQAVTNLDKAVSLNATIGREFFPICYCRMGDYARAEAEVAALTALASQAYVAPHRLAVATSAFPDPGRSLDFLEQGLQQGDPRLIWIDAWPVFDPLRSHPRFQSLKQRLGLD